jgi:hypothetical protein
LKVISMASHYYPLPAFNPGGGINFEPVNRALDNYGQTRHRNALMEREDKRLALEDERWRTTDARASRNALMQQTVFDQSQDDRRRQHQGYDALLEQQADPLTRNALMAAGPETGTKVMLGRMFQDPTSDQREYNLAKSQGFDGTFMDYQTTLKRAGANQNNINMPTIEREEDKALGKAAGEAGADVFKRAAMSGGKLRSLADLEARMDKLNTSRIADAKLSAAQWAKALGVSDQTLGQFGVPPDFVGDAQAFSAITGKMMVEMIGQGGFPANNFSDADREFLMSTLPRLVNAPRGNRLIVAAAKRSAQADVDKAKAFQTWRLKNRSGSYFDFEADYASTLNDRFADLKAEADQMLKAADPTTVRSAPTPTRYHNPQTGEVIEWDGQQWKAAQ